MSVQASVSRIIRAGGNGCLRVRGGGQSGVGIRRKKSDVRIGKTGNRQPDMILSVRIFRGVYMYFPDSGSGPLKAKQDQLAAGGWEDQMVVQLNDRIFQSKLDFFRLLQGGGDSRNGFSRRGAEADGEFLRSLPPDFAEKSPAVFRHQDFHPVVGILSRRGG